MLSYAVVAAAVAARRCWLPSNAASSCCPVPHGLQQVCDLTLKHAVANAVLHVLLEPLHDGTMSDGHNY